MTRFIVIAAFALITTTPALACDPRDDTHVQDLVRAQERQAETLKKIERVERDRLRMQVRAQRNASR